MLKIGEFSRLGQVTVKTLRHYDHLGLLEPAEVDPFTGYRYYAVSQLDRLDEIMALKDLDLSLEQIGTILEDDLSRSEAKRLLQQMLQQKHAELKTRIEMRQAQLARIEARLGELRTEDKIMAEVTIKELPAQRVLAYRSQIPDTSAIKSTFDVVNTALADNPVPLVPAPWLALYHHDEYRETDLDFEIALPVEDDFEGTLSLGDGRVLEVRELPAETMACITIHLREQADVREGNRELARWVEANGYTYTDAPCREAYGEPRLPDGTVRFETQFPVTRK